MKEALKFIAVMFLVGLLLAFGLVLSLIPSRLIDWISRKAGVGA